ncbi:MAG: hypothetical protein DRJ61_10915 [Acidobacteria bacterium]|nr:MAG: hypothetical protein DRJ61_10915 [Acidobacteriota bacterium]
MSKTILLADDSLTIQKVVELTFSDTDFEVIATSSGDQLLEQLPSSGADIVICDTIMPGTDGYAVCQAIKSESTTLHIPVILMTGTFEPFDRDRALAAGCSEIITKPFEARSLVETVERLVNLDGIAAPAPEAFAGLVEPPDFAGTVTPPGTEEATSEFGTMLSNPTEAPTEFTEEPESDALDFTSTGFAEMVAAGAKSDGSAGTAPEHGIEFEAAAPEEPKTPKELEIIEEHKAEPTQPIPAAVVAEVTDSFDAAEPGMFAEADDAEIEVQPATAFPVETDPVVEPVPEAEILPELEDSFEEDDENSVGGLSNADVDRIARRVVELASGQLEKIAWDVIPDMAEIVVRERLRELEEDIENAAGTTEPN